MTDDRSWVTSWPSRGSQSLYCPPPGDGQQHDNAKKDTEGRHYQM